ncbi:ImmA/IrrE family metallo-endopeptidase [Alicyclobacillus sp. ALC3]|uniref:ImmA/IrrE family metallo-endopeptidase n=1 Tax=Alicyclobacillus sp. ALC3 TaxID=2796143 RepID=UPI00237823F5|nr:ImmA/IrrE family metallo-endopeptidase [Alicyclobacillus sp. ALC3]WDL96897.1 ImmA/IrrE family metallo-endopeptidase [Alicyclobacillus sp. ALC3]
MTAFPIDAASIIKRNGWGLKPYSEYAKSRHVDVNTVARELPSEDGFTVRKSGKYTIAYNDGVRTRERIRWTLLHEIGHIYLGHFKEFDETLLNRGGLDDRAMRVLENEADVFARNVLAPAPIVRELSRNVNTAYLLRTVFDLSGQATRMRIRYLSADLRFRFESLTQQFDTFINRVLYGKECTVCHYYFATPGAIYCPVCRNTDAISTYKGVTPDMIYDGFELDGNGYPKHECPRCGNEQLSGEHCKVCGVSLTNKCTNFQEDSWGNIEWECGEVADGNARFCTKCGSPTTYFSHKLLLPWDSVKRQPRDRPVSDLFADPFADPFEKVTSAATKEISDQDLPF